MIDPETLRAMFSPDVPLRFALFDKQVGLPLEALPSRVAQESEQVLSADRIEELVAAKWFPVVHLDLGGTVTACVPLYVPSRVGLFLDLEASGAFTSRELAAFADWEEHVIDDILVDNEMPYDHDDHLRILLANEQEEVSQCDRERECVERSAAGDPAYQWYRLELSGDDGTLGHTGVLAKLDAKIAVHQQTLDRLLSYCQRRFESGRNQRLSGGHYYAVG